MVELSCMAYSAVSFIYLCPFVGDQHAGGCQSITYCWCHTSSGACNMPIAGHGCPMICKTGTNKCGVYSADHTLRLKISCANTGGSGVGSRATVLASAQLC